MTRLPLCLFTLLYICTFTWAFYPPVETAGPLTVSITPFDDVTSLKTPIPVTVTVKSDADAEITGTVRLAVTDDWRVEAPNPQRFTVAAKGETTLTFSVLPGPASYAALYPVHAYASFPWQQQRLEAHPIFITKVLGEALSNQPAAKARGLEHLLAVRCNQPVLVDGALTEWNNAVPVPLTPELVSLGELEPGDFGGILYLMHDEQNLYLGLRITDDMAYGLDITSRDFVNSDYVRLYLSKLIPSQRSATTLDKDDLVVCVNPLAEGGALMKVPDYGQPTIPLGNPPEIKTSASLTAAGWDAEIAVPWSLIGGKPVASCGFNLMLGDSDLGQREIEMTVGNQSGAYFMNPKSYVSLELTAAESVDATQLLTATIVDSGALALDRLSLWRVQSQVGDQSVVDMPLGWLGVDPKTALVFTPSTKFRGTEKACIDIHPPYKGGNGVHWGDIRLTLPTEKPIKLSFFNAIRDSGEAEPLSDGIDFRIYVAADGEDFEELFKRFTDTKTWEPAEVDLSDYAGKTITLRLWTGPGPQMNSTCDSGFWGEPTLFVGEQLAEESPQALAERHTTAITRAKAALKGETDHFQWLLDNPCGRFGVGWAAGANSVADGVLAFVSEDGREVIFDNLIIAVDGQNIRDPRSNINCIGGKAVWTPDGKQTTIQDFLRRKGQSDENSSITTWATMFVEDGAFKIKFSMPTEERTARGEPRFTNLAVGPASQQARRVYAGFGNVIENPKAYTLSEGGFTLSTRHVGMDFENGISLLQASDVFPYRFVVNPEEALYSLQTGHDATLMFVPSTKGAFAAARQYREAANFKPAGGVDKMKGKFVIDWWGGHEIADDIRRAGAYGLSDTMLIKHAWQRWGYDYRLPDIYPPNGDMEQWNDVIAACRETKILFAPHDNYIDFYPDASNFSYKHILFNPDGTPQVAWYNPGPDALSYRWLPGAYWPWLERNIKLIKEDFAPGGYFIDVFSAIPLLDYYDQQGNFHTKVECGEHWGRTFDYVREQLGDNAPQVCEAGHDGLIGHLDAAQADHNSAKSWHWDAGDAERTPWHDMASHDSFVLLAGGLGDRYAGGDANASWGSDDYLTNTIMGGRTPMASGPCQRHTVMTYWLQHDICKELARQQFETHEFVGDNIHRQHTTFSGGGEAWVNRNGEPWEINGYTLPRFGYYAKSGDITSAIISQNGLTAAFAKSPGVTFVDSRPNATDISGRAPYKTHATSVTVNAEGLVEVEFEFEVLKPLSKGLEPFFHITHEKVVDQGEQIALQAGIDLPEDALTQVGTYYAKSSFRIPADAWEGDWKLRYGMYSPKNGGRVVPVADIEGSRVKAGIIRVSYDENGVQQREYVKEETDVNAPQLNTDGAMIDFGGIITNGAFRLLHNDEQWQLFPLQGSLAFKATLNLDALGAAGRSVATIEALDQDGIKLNDEVFTQTGSMISLDLNGQAFSYRITFK